MVAIAQRVTELVLELVRGFPRVGQCRHPPEARLRRRPPYPDETGGAAEYAESGGTVGVLRTSAPASRRVVRPTWVFSAHELTQGGQQPVNVPFGRADAETRAQGGAVTGLTVAGPLAEQPPQERMCAELPVAHADAVPVGQLDGDRT